jgi:hypothetical protein
MKGIVSASAMVAALLLAACSGKQEAGKAPVKTAAAQKPPSSLPGYVREPDLGDRPEHGRSGTPPPASVDQLPPPPIEGPGAIGVIGSIGPSVKVKPNEAWKTTVGMTTYKTTIHFYDGKIVLGSNGLGWKDTSDGQDGVYILDAKTGNLMDQIVPPGGDEKDVNGVALTKDAIFFGTDQGVLYKTDWKGKVLWKTLVSGDVEAAPALADLNGDGVLDAVVGSEGGVFYAVSGKKGKVLWTIKAGKSYYGATGFLGAAALYDADGDGVDDVFVPSRDEVFRALGGKNGKLLWQHQGTSSMHGAPIIVDADGDGKMEVVFTECYSDVYCANAATGSIEWKATLQNPDGGIEGLFSPVGWYPDAACVLVATAWWGAQEGVYCIGGKDGKTKWRYNEPQKNISSGAVIGDIDGKPGAEVVFGTEAGAVVALDASGQTVMEHPLGGPVECTPTLADVDGDGLIEIIAAANNGSLYLLETPGQAPPVIGYHRGDPQNRGNL